MNKATKEPIKNVKVWIILGVLFAMINPWYFPQSFEEILIYGIPLWAVVIIIASLLLSAYLSYVLKYHWVIEEEQEEAETKGEK
ncbi:hypothetical protein [Halobacillus sp. A5]|uniref:hypothetical protein n=1 Tax=Halobacillus sp. A5 TaxID=2880263 RepID=UPI0020A65F0B|nr:hypothetical protein [Halobacillus sp. A5]MCP3026547.1 hypothetical protein [Halobacillus sp. A5]